jgi:GNAT superfamily N-acetyltransferase
VTDAVRIRAARANDASDLARSRHALYSEHAPARERLDEYVDRFAGFVHDALASEAWRIWVAELEGRIVGTMWLQIVERVPRPGEDRGALPIGYLTNVFVDPELRNGGLGSRMVEEVVTWARGRGVEEIIVWPSERSYPFYERAGFSRTPDPLVLHLNDEEPKHDSRSSTRSR